MIFVQRERDLALLKFQNESNSLQIRALTLRMDGMAQLDRNLGMVANDVKWLIEVARSRPIRSEGKD